MAMLDTIAILDLERGADSLVAAGALRDATWATSRTRDGGIVLFNNFLTAERSSVVTLDPRTRLVTREYTGPEAAPLHSRRSGRVQVLPNGNVLVVETEGGRALELSPEGELVWEFHSPFRVGESRDKVASLYALERVGRGRGSWLSSSSEGASPP